MSGLQFNTITGAGSAAANRVATALVPKKQATAAQAVPMSSLGSAKLKAADATGGTSGTGASGAAPVGSNVSSTDFMTLLVGELKNQDPTQPTDPNQYITQLAQVNSLEQLIQINQGVGTLDGLVAPATATTAAAMKVTT